MRLAPCALALCCVLLAGPASAEIYRWSDDQGKVHFTQDLTQVPPRYRKQAEDAAKAKSAGVPSKVQVYSGGAERTEGAAPASAPPEEKQKTWRIRVSRAGTSMLVNVRLNNSVTAPFLIDTGASDVLISERVAQQLGLEFGSEGRTKRYSTANGTVEHPVVTLRSVSLGGAEVQDVPASVSPHMEVGLLGLSYFNHFNYNIDAASGLVTLRRNRLAESGKIRGGRSEAQWRSEFRALHWRVARVEADYESKAEAKSRERRRLERERQDLERQLDMLEGEADRAHVPMGWRD